MSAQAQPPAFKREDAIEYELTAPATTHIKPALHWPGGKSRLLKYLLPHILPHTCYCEPFGGGLAVFLAKPRSHHEIINDANGDLVNFYRCVRFHRDPLLTELEFVLTSREEFKDFNSQVGLTDIQRAARWYGNKSLDSHVDFLAEVGRMGRCTNSDSWNLSARPLCAA